MQKAICLLLVLIVSLNLSKVNALADEVLNYQEKSGTELLVLVDNSSSLSANGKSETELEWAENICAYIRETDVVLKYLWFDDNDNPYTDRMIDGSDMVHCLEKLREEVNHEGEYTDLERAMKDAREYFDKESTASNQYILILSDGNLDLLDNTMESESKERFSKNMQDFVSSEKQGERKIILTGTMDAEDDVYKIYSELTTAEKDDGITYISLDEDFESVIQESLDLIHIPVKNGSITDLGGGKAEFEIKETCCRAIVSIRNTEKNISMQNVSVGVEHNGENVSIADKCVLEYSMFVYLENPKIGEYTVTLPEGKYEFDIKYQKSYCFDKVELFILNDDQKEANISDRLNQDIKVYEIEANSFLIGMELNAGGEMNESDYSVWYCMQEIDEEQINDSIESTVSIKETYEKCRFKDNRGSMLVLNELNNLEQGTYALKLQVSSGGMTYFSNLVLVRVLGDSSSPIPVEYETIELKVGEKFKLDDITNELKEDFLGLKIILVQRKDKHGTMEAMDIWLGEEKNDKLYSSFDNDTMCFEEDGEYEAEIRDESNNVLKKVKFMVSEEKWWMVLWNTICSFFK